MIILFVLQYKIFLRLIEFSFLSYFFRDKLRTRADETRKRITMDNLCGKLVPRFNPAAVKTVTFSVIEDQEIIFSYKFKDIVHS